jgi:hypothetical protein
MLYKAIGIILSALFIAAIQVNAASAGCGGGHGGFRHFKSYNNQAALQQSRARKARAIAAAKQKKAVQQARVEKKAAASKVAEAAPVAEETTTAAADKVPENELNVASVAETCTKFVAETGTTVTVECAKQ